MHTAVRCQRIDDIGFFGAVFQEHGEESALDCRDVAGCDQGPLGPAGYKSCVDAAQGTAVRKKVRKADPVFRQAVCGRYIICGDRQVFLIQEIHLAGHCFQKGAVSPGEQGLVLSHSAAFASAQKDRAAVRCVSGNIIHARLSCRSVIYQCFYSVTTMYSNPTSWIHMETFPPVVPKVP